MIVALAALLLVPVLIFDDEIDDAFAGEEGLRRLQDHGSWAWLVGMGLIVGDLVHHKAHAWLEGPVREGRPSPDLEAWKRALDELLAYGPDAVVYGGRGEAGPAAQGVAEQKRYLDAMRELVGGYVQELGAAKGELCAGDASAHYREIARRAGARFPDYALAYMIEYGVYGLAQQLACEGG